MRSEVKAPLLLVAAVLAFSAMGALIKVAGARIPSIEQVFFRGLFGVVILLVTAPGRWRELAGKRRGLLLLRSLFGTIAMINFFWAITQIPVADTMLLNQCNPIFVLPLAAWLLGERITPRHVGLVAVALVGVALVIRPSLDFVNLPGLSALASAMFAAVAYVLVRKLSATESSFTIVFWFMTFSTLAAVPLMIPVFVFPSPIEWVELVAMGLLAAAGQLLMTRAYAYGEAGRLAVIGSLGAVFGVGWDLVLWDHVPDLLTAAGGAVIIAACTLIQRMKKAPDPR